MSKWDKLITRICNLSKDIRFDELRKVLESYGYEMNAPRSGSSHYTFRKQGCLPITIPKHEPIKKVYVEMVRRIVESEAKNDEDAESLYGNLLSYGNCWRQRSRRICGFLSRFARLHYLWLDIGECGSKCTWCKKSMDWSCIRRWCRDSWTGQSGRLFWTV